MAQCLDEEEGQSGRGRPFWLSNTRSLGIDPLSRDWHIALERVLARLEQMGAQPRMEARERAVWIQVPARYEAALVRELERMFSDKGIDIDDRGAIPSVEMADHERWGRVLTVEEIEQAHRDAGEH